MEIPALDIKKTSLSEILEEESMGYSRTCFQTVRNEIDDGFYTAKSHFHSIDNHDMINDIRYLENILTNNQNSPDRNSKVYNYKSLGNSNK